MAMLLPMLADERSRKSIMKIVKYLLIFGGLGGAILYFVFMGKKFNVFKKVSDWFKGVTGGGIIGKFGKSIGNVFGLTGLAELSRGDIGGFAQKQIEFSPGYQIAKAAAPVVAKSIAEKRREFNRISKIAGRKMGVIAKDKRITADIRKRSSIIKTSFRRLSKKRTVSVAKSFDRLFKRKKRKKSRKKKKKGWW